MLFNNVIAVHSVTIKQCFPIMVGRKIPRVTICSGGSQVLRSKQEFRWPHQLWQACILHGVATLVFADKIKLQKSPAVASPLYGCLNHTLTPETELCESYSHTRNIIVRVRLSHQKQNDKARHLKTNAVGNFCTHGIGNTNFCVRD